MALDDRKHVEAVALIRQLVEDPLSPTLRTTAEGWLHENHPAPAVYMAAVRTMADDEPEPPR